MIEITCTRCQNPVQAITPEDLSGLVCPGCQESIEIPPPRDDVATLLCIQGDLEGADFAVDEAFSFGRAPGNAAKLRELKVSRRHAVIEIDGDQYFIRDLESGNGTYLNDQLIDRVELRNNDAIRIAGTVFLFRKPGSDSSDNTHESQIVIGEESVFEQTKFEIDYGNQTILAPATDSGADVEALGKANEKLRILYEVTNNISMIHHREELLQEILNKVFEFLPADRGAILLFKHGTEEIETTAVKFREEKSAGETLVVSQSILSRVMGDRKSLLTSDTMVDDHLSQAHSIISQGIRSAMSVPLICREELLGILHIDSTRRSEAFNEDNLQLLVAIGGQAGVAIENQRESETRARLARYLSPSLVTQVVNKEIDLDMGGTLKRLTILFSDIRDFTPFSEKYPAQEVVSTLNRYFEEMVGVIFRHGGTLDKFIGDATMVFWGAPMATPQDPLLAVQAALEMQRRLFLLNCRFTAEGKEPIRMGIGINTGDVVVGNMGATERREYTVIGKEVNLAQRVESLTRGHQVFISEATYREVRDHVRVVKLEPTMVKGIRDKIHAYHVLAVRGDGGSDVEHRLEERLQFYLPAVATHEQSEKSVASAVVDVSSGGAGLHLFIAPEFDIQQGDAMNVVISLSDRDLDRGFCRGVVVHRTPVSEKGQKGLLRIGLQFTEVDERFENLLGQDGVGVVEL